MRSGSAACSLFDLAGDTRDSGTAPVPSCATRDPLTCDPDPPPTTHGAEHSLSAGISLPTPTADHSLCFTP
jgi:hypothetical protein